jgi:hypothetical protein
MIGGSMSHQSQAGPDAVRVPLSYARGETSGERLRYLKAKFAVVMGVMSVAYFNQGTYYFIAKDTGQTLRFPFGHDRYGQSRYEWQDQGDGISYGHLVEGA